MFSRFARRILIDKHTFRFNLKPQTLNFSSRDGGDIHFSLETEMPNKTKNKSNAPIKKVLATTNKAMFGPLLETTKEKRQRLKYEALGQDIPKKAKKRQFKRRMKDEDFESFLDQPENSHFRGIFNDHQKPEISLGSSTDENLNTSEKKVKKAPTKVIHHDNDFIVMPRPKFKKITFESNNNNGYNLKKIYTEGKNYNFIESQRKTRIVLQKKSNNSLKESKEADKDIQGFSKYNNVSQIRIDNSKWTAAPNIINLNELSKITLVPPNYVTKHTEDEFISTIGLFEGGYQKLPSVTKILDETMPISSRIALDKWKAKMIAELGEQGFAEYQQNNFAIGKAFHGCIEARLHNKEPSSEDLSQCGGHWQSIEAVMPEVNSVVALESRIIHPNLYYQGLVDCVAHYRGKPVLIEWKTSKKPKTTVKSMYDNPLQVAAYIGALNYDSNYNLQQPIDSGLLVAAYECGAPADVHLLKSQDCQNLWNIWLNRLTMFWQKQKLIFPID